MAGSKDQKKYPPSPSELDIGGLKGKISGVTRVGPKAIALAACLIGGLIVAILLALNRPTTKAAIDAPALPSVPPKQEQDQHFGADVPIVATPEPTDTPTEAPIVLPTNPPSTPAPAPPTQAAQPPAPGQPVPVAAAPVSLTPEQIEERKQRRELLDQAIHSKIIASEVKDAGGAGSPIAPTCVDASGDLTGKGAQQQQQQQMQPGPYGAAGYAGAAGASNSRDFLNGPTGQYSCSGQLASANSAKDDYLPSKRAAPASEYEVLAGSIIPAALISGINSELPGLISAQVRQDVYDSKTGRYLLIPKGSRLLGLYKSGVAYGQSRVLVAWTRLIFPDTSGVDLLNMSGVDVEGNAGLTGTVDNHYGKIFGAALLTSILAIGLQLSQPNQQQQSVYPSQQQLAAAAASQQIISVGSQLSNRALNIAPTIQIPKGYPFSVMVDRDITFSGPYQGM